jgi:hypothetical protein
MQLVNNGMLTFSYTSNRNNAGLFIFSGYQHCALMAVVAIITISGVKLNGSNQEY